MGNLYDKKDAILNIRLDQESRMRLDELSTLTGFSASSLARAAINMLLDRTYDEDGYVINLEAYNGSKDINPADGYFPLRVICRYLELLEADVRRMLRYGKARRVKIHNKVYVKLGDVIRHGQSHNHS